MHERGGWGAGHDSTEAREEAELESQRLAHDVNRYPKERQETATALQRMEKDHDWIPNQRQYVFVSRRERLTLAGCVRPTRVS